MLKLQATFLYSISTNEQVKLFHMRGVDIMHFNTRCTFKLPVTRMDKVYELIRNRFLVITLTLYMKRVFRHVLTLVSIM